MLLFAAKTRRIWREELTSITKLDTADKTKGSEQKEILNGRRGSHGRGITFTFFSKRKDITHKLFPLLWSLLNQAALLFSV